MTIYRLKSHEILVTLVLTGQLALAMGWLKCAPNVIDCKLPAVAVVYDETSNSVNIGGTVVQVGDSIVVGSKKVTVKEV